VKIAIVATGGTIDKDYTTALGGVNFEVGEPAVQRLLNRLTPMNLEYTVQSILRKDSLDLTDEDRRLLRRTVAACPEDRVLVTHGTDTMIESARVLSDIAGKTIVMTGSMRPEKFSDSDAEFNLGLALGALNVLPPGTYIAMSGRVYPWHRCRKDRATERFVEA
jgi:L-asparaginase